MNEVLLKSRLMMFFFNNEDQNHFITGQQSLAYRFDGEIVVSWQAEFHITRQRKSDRSVFEPDQIPLRAFV